jgi:hypothetical protein
MGEGTSAGTTAAGPSVDDGSASTARRDTGIVTRLLCAGTHLDSSYADAVIAELLGEGHRFVAPSYGFDAVPVLGNALLARDRQKAKQTVIMLSPLVVVVSAFFGIKGAVIGFLIALWVVWAAVFLEKLLTLQVLTIYGGGRREGPDHADIGAPRHRQLNDGVVRRIANEQDSSNGVVYYSGFKPFVGAGFLVKSSSFPILLSPPADSEDEAEEFTGDEMMRYVQDRLRGALRDDLSVERQIRGLEVTRKWYRTAVGRERPWWPDPLSRPAVQGEEAYDSAREYLCIRVGAWEQELVNSLFVNFDVRGRTLYSELHTYVLPPVRASYHTVNRLPDRITPAKVIGIALESSASMIGEAIMAVVLFPFLLFRQAKKRKERLEVAADAADAEGVWSAVSEPSGGLADFGARRSIREMATIDGYHHFFQSVDAVKYAKIVERRVLEIILDFLEQKNVDSSEYRTRQTSILNYGILQTGSGRIVTQGATAVGPNATVS